MERLCSYKYTPCRGKIEFHHPVSDNPSVGLDLCEGHHSVLQGRRKKYNTEISVRMEDLRTDLRNLELEVVTAAGLTAGDIDKH